MSERETERDTERHRERERERERENELFVVRGCAFVRMQRGDESSVLVSACVRER